jgi:uncharacterized protein YjbI with pentapeptide repeats
MGAKLTYAHLRNADLTAANLRDATLDGQAHPESCRRGFILRSRARRPDILVNNARQAR